MNTSKGRSIDKEVKYAVTNNTATFTNITTTTKLLQLILQLQELVRLRVLRWKGRLKDIKSAHQEYIENILPWKGETWGHQEIDV